MHKTLTHTREREKYFIVYTLELKRQQLFPVVAGLFRGRGSQGQVMETLTLYFDEIGAIL